MTRRLRSSRAEIIARELDQAAIVAELVLIGADDAAAKVMRCWADRIIGDQTCPRYRCRSVASLSCRRPPLPSWWKSFRSWSEDGGPTSYFRLPVADQMEEVPAIARSLRNLRDRLARKESWLWFGVAVLGVADQDHAHVIVSHPGVARSLVKQRFRSLWPRLPLLDVPMTDKPAHQLDAGETWRERTGVPADALSSSAVNPTLTTLTAISEALELSLVECSIPRTKVGARTTDALPTAERKRKPRFGSGAV